MNTTVAAINWVLNGCLLILLGTLAVPASALKDKFKRPLLFFWSVYLAGATATAFGTWMTIKGSQEDGVAGAKRAEEVLTQTKHENARANAQLNTKVQQVLTTLQDAKESTQGASQERAVEGIQDDFEQWAEDFKKRRPSMLLNVDPRRLSESALRDVLSARWRPIIEIAVDTIDNTVTQYNQTMGQDVELTTLELPEDISQITVALRQISFPDGNKWEIELANAYPVAINAAPQIVLSITKGSDAERKVLGFVTVTFLGESNEFYFSGSASGLTAPIQFEKERRPIADFKTAFRSQFRTLFESQVVQLRPKPKK